MKKQNKMLPKFGNVSTVIKPLRTTLVGTDI